MPRVSKAQVLSKRRTCQKMCANEITSWANTQAHRQARQNPEAYKQWMGRMTTVDGMRPCSDCKELKPTDCFSSKKPDKYGKVYLQSVCKPCMVVRVKKWQAENIERFRESQREYRRKRYHSDPEFRAAVLATNARSYTKKKEASQDAAQ